jgi:two-component system chemotaxis response regulator CheB
LLARRPLPVIVSCSATDKATAAAVETLQAGAVDVLVQPSDVGPDPEVAAHLTRLVNQLRSGPAPRFHPRSTEPAAPAWPASACPSDSLLLLGGATGGTYAIESVLSRLPAGGPTALVVQHLPALLTRRFVERLDRVCSMMVIEAQGGEALAPGMIYVAPPGRHLSVEQRGVRVRTALSDGPAVHAHRPSIDVLFHAASRLSGIPIVAAVLSGAGEDGADGLRALRRAGASTLVEDEASCVIFGAPRHALTRDPDHQVATLVDLPDRILEGLDRAATVELTR